MSATRPGRRSVGDVVARLGEGANLEAVLRAALGDEELLVALAFDGGARWARPDGTPLAPPARDPGHPVTELEHDGEVVALVIHGRLARREARVLRALSSAAGLAALNARLALELQASVAEARRSRGAVVAATDDTRRRVERDLHDGAQQRLVAAALDVQLVRMDAREPEVDAALARTGEALQQALAQLRRLARGLFPAILPEQGLAPALVALSEDSPVPLRLVTLPEGRFAAEIESGAYFCVAAALAGATGRVAAAVVRDGDRLRLQVGGVLLDDDRLLDLRDRVEALGGELHHDREAAEIRAALPIDPS